MVEEVCVFIFCFESCFGFFCLGINIKNGIVLVVVVWFVSIIGFLYWYIKIKVVVKFRAYIVMNVIEVNGYVVFVVL